MAANEELFRLVLEVAGQEKVAKLSADLADAERELAEMAAAANLMGQALPVAAMTSLAQKVAALKGELSQVNGALNATAAAEAKAAEAAERAAQRAEAAAARKAAAADRAADMAEKAARREALANDLAATRRAVADDKARMVAERGSSVDRDTERALKRSAGPAAMADKVFDAERAGAKSRLGLGVANMLQDTIQGGSPAYAVNNVLGMAGDKGIKSLLGEGIAAAGGIGAIGAAFATVAVVAGGAFLLIDSGLKSAKLDWGDFGTVVANLGPISAASEAFQGFGTLVTDTATTIIDALGGEGTAGVLGEYWSSFFDTVGGGFGAAIGFVDEYTLGWGRATDAAKVHKDELERGVQSARQYAEAVKDLGKFQSDQQKEKESTGKLVGQELADLGGAGGIEGLATQLAAKSTPEPKEGDEKVKVQEVDEKGKLQEVEITRREAARREIMARLNQARQGDPNAIGDIAQRLRGAGMDPSKFLNATNGIDNKALMKSTGDAEEAALKDQHDQGERSRKKDEQAQKEEEKRLEVEATQNEKAYDLKVKEEEKAARDREKLAKEGSKARMDAPGLDEFIKGELMAGAAEGDLGGMLRDMGFSEEEAGTLIDKGAKGAMEQGLKGDGEQARNSQTLQGGSALRDAIQGGVTNAPDLAKQQLEKLNAAVTYLQRIADQRQDYTARAT